MGGRCTGQLSVAVRGLVIVCPEQAIVSRVGEFKLLLVGAVNRVSFPGFILAQFVVVDVLKDIALVLVDEG